MSLAPPWEMLNSLEQMEHTTENSSFFEGLMHGQRVVYSFLYDCLRADFDAMILKRQKQRRSPNLNETDRVHSALQCINCTA